MRKFVVSACMIGTALALAACSSDGEGHVDVAPYSLERTAGHGGDASSQEAETVFRSGQRK